MKSRQRLSIYLAAFILLGLVAGCATITPEQRQNKAETVISDWASYSRLAAAMLISKYGPPDRVKNDELTWDEKGPWKRMTVWDVSGRYYYSQAGAYNIEQTISYRVPAEKRRALAVFSDNIRVSPDGAELAARSKREELNLLTLNLACEIIVGTKDPFAAQRFYVLTLRLADEGKSSPYMHQLLRRVAQPSGF